MARKDQIRTKSPHLGNRRNRPSSSLARGYGQDRISRAQALVKVKHYLRRTPNSPSALGLIDLFQLSAEELLEQGVSFEQLKALASVYMIRSDG